MISNVAPVAFLANPANRKAMILPISAARFAIESAEIAGGATFCEIKPEEVETYINRALMEIAALAADDVDLVVSRIVFSNIYNHSIARGPDLGCSAYEFFFQAQSNRISR